MPAKKRSRKKPDRRRRGFERVSGLLQRQIRTVGESRGFPVARLLIHWAEIVGSDVARIARPANVSYSNGTLGATLTLVTTGPQAPILSMQLESIRQRVNACYGYSAISRIRISQISPDDFNSGLACDEQTRKSIPEPDPTVRECARKAVADVTDDGLRHALELFGESVLTNLQNK